MGERWKRFYPRPLLAYRHNWLSISWEKRKDGKGKGCTPDVSPTEGLVNIPSFCVLPIPWWHMEIDPIGMTMWVAVGGGGGRWRFGRSVGCCRWEALFLEHVN